MRLQFFFWPDYRHITRFWAAGICLVTARLVLTDKDVFAEHSSRTRTGASDDQVHKQYCLTDQHM